mmetsp:Transcript_45815/g.55605  ORF Transcript_45815/g.55605 Transcript_45815/m.55605 type:complete len:101 (+) Transcript_45815:175-477(+)
MHPREKSSEFTQTIRRRDVKSIIDETVFETTFLKYFIDESVLYHQRASNKGASRISSFCRTFRQQQRELPPSLLSIAKPGTVSPFSDVGGGSGPTDRRTD